MVKHASLRVLPTSACPMNGPLDQLVSGHGAVSPLAFGLGTKIEPRSMHKTPNDQPRPNPSTRPLARPRSRATFVCRHQGPWCQPAEEWLMGLEATGLPVAGEEGDEAVDLVDLRVKTLGAGNVQLPCHGKLTTMNAPKSRWPV